ncbi:hypothetical protein [Flavobacterium sp.]|jgi:hypothetical protein|uniref:hypothetical protein n=1 Tax=Flavobacterium sp. TaxID=239 RepID=UPI0037BEE254
MLNSTLGKRIDTRLKQLGKGQQWLANQIIERFPSSKCDVKVINALVKRKSQRTKYASQIADVLGVSLTWLIDGTGMMLTAKNDHNANQNIPGYVSGLSPEETKIIDSYRSKPRHDQLNVLKLLDIEPEDFAQSA